MLITDNAYLILGLKGDEDDKDITKRYQAIEKQIKVKINKEYPYDLSFINYKKLRTLENIKKSFHNLTDLNNKLYQCFFRFNILDEKNLQIFNSYKNGFIKDALETWETEYIKTNNSNYLLNYVIGGLLELETDNNNTSNETLALKIPKYLKKILDSEIFINDFIKRYNRNSNIKISKNKINDFIKSLPQYICEQFFTLGEKHGTFILYKGTYKLYQISSKRIESSKKVLDEYNNIENNYSYLKSPYTRKDTENINKAVKSIINSLNELSELGIKENDPKLGKMRDNIATLLIDFANKTKNLKSHEDENNLLTSAKKIAYSKRIKDKVIIKTNETTTISENDIDNLRKRVINQISSTVTKQVINDHFIIERITETEVFLIYDNNFIASTMLEKERKKIEALLEKELGRKVSLNIQGMSKEEYFQRLMGTSTNQKTGVKKNDETTISENNADNLRKRVIKQISSTATRQVINDHTIIEKITETQVFLIYDNNMIAKIMLEKERKEIEALLEKELGRKVSLNIQGMSKEEYFQRLMGNNTSNNEKTGKKNDKSKDEINNLISSIYLSLDIIKKPLLLNNYIKLLAEISKVNDMIKKIEASNLVKEEHTNKIRDNIGEAILTAAKELYTKSGSYERSYKLLLMAKKMSRSRWTLNKIINELNILEDTERRIKGEKKKDTKYSTSNGKKGEDNNKGNQRDKTKENNNSEKNGKQQKSNTNNNNINSNMKNSNFRQFLKDKYKKYEGILSGLGIIAYGTIVIGVIRIVVGLIVFGGPYLIYLLVNYISTEAADSGRMAIIIIGYFIAIKIILEKFTEN